MAAAELRDRRVIGHLHRGDDLERHITTTAALDLPRGAQPDAVGVEQQANHHHPRVIRRAALPVRAIRPIKPIEIHLLDRAQHRPHEMILRQPIRQRRRQQQHPSAVARDEVLTHPGMVLNHPDDTRKPDSLTNERARRPPRRAAPWLLLRAAGQLKRQSRRRRWCGDKPEASARRGELTTSARVQALEMPRWFIVIEGLHRHAVGRLKARVAPTARVRCVARGARGAAAS